MTKRNMNLTAVCLITSDNQQWYIHGNQATNGNKGVFLLEGAKGMDDILYKFITSQSARQYGSTYLDRTMDSQELDLPIMVDGETTAQMQYRKQMFLKALFKDEFRLGFFSPLLGWRWMTCRATDVAEVTGTDTNPDSTSFFDVGVTALDPRPQGWSSRKQVLLGEATEVTLTNDSDMDSWPVLIFEGPPKQVSSLEVPGFPEVEIPPITNGMEKLMIHTQPSKARAVSSMKGILPWTDTAYKRIQMQVPAGESLNFIINTKGYRSGVSKVTIFQENFYHNAY